MKVEHTDQNLTNKEIDNIINHYDELAEQFKEYKHEEKQLTSEEQDLVDYFEEMIEYFADDEEMKARYKARIEKIKQEEVEL